MTKLVPTPQRKTLIALKDIRADEQAQCREYLSAVIINEYAELLEAGVELPPVTVFFDGADHWLSDGFHRFRAAQRCKRTKIKCDVREGGLRDAILFAVGANSKHGLRRTNADKRKAILKLLNDPEWVEWSDREIAKRCDVDHKTVAGYRAPPPIKTWTLPSPRDNGPRISIRAEPRGEFPIEADRKFTSRHGTTGTRPVVRKTGEESEVIPIRDVPPNPIAQAWVNASASERKAFADQFADEIYALQITALPPAMH